MINKSYTTGVEVPGEDPLTYPPTFVKRDAFCAINAGQHNNPKNTTARTKSCLMNTD
jgi:hypothetical protein